MVSYKEAGKMLDKAMEALPQGIFDELNGGVNLIEAPMESPKGGYILGLYHNNMMGRYIEIFYGSFVGLYGDIPPAQFERRLRSTLHHELTHHIEGLAGDRSLEHWDEEQDEIWDELMDAEYHITGSILFADDDDSALAPAAKALFAMYAGSRCPEIPAESAGIFEAGRALQPDCRHAAEALGADFAGHEFKLLDEELFDSYDAVMCMTLAQVDGLLERFPGSEAKVMCVDDTDILRPRLRMGWKKALERVNAVCNDLSCQLRLEDEDEAHGGDEIAEVVVRTIGTENAGTCIPAIAALEREYFSLPWTEEQLSRYMERENSLFFAAFDGSKLVGYIGAAAVLDEMEIFNVAVAESHRRRGIGERLVCALLDAALEMGGIERVTLEVRAGNSGAIALYEKLGFEEVGRRKNYYEKPREDAVLMDLILG